MFVSVNARISTPAVSRVFTTFIQSNTASVIQMNNLRSVKPEKSLRLCSSKTPSFRVKQSDGKNNNLFRLVLSVPVALTYAFSKKIDSTCNAQCESSEATKSNHLVLTDVKAAQRIDKAIERAGQQQALEEIFLSEYKSPNIWHQILNQPISHTHTQIVDLMPVEADHSRSLPVAWAFAKGERDKMEDADLAEEIIVIIDGVHVKAQLTGIFDGHGGSEISTYVRDNVSAILTINLEKFNGNGLTDKGIYNALRQTMVDLDSPDDLYVSHQMKKTGTTVNLALKFGQDLYIANVGDSRAILITQTEFEHRPRIVQVSEDQNAQTDFLMKKYMGRHTKNKYGEVDTIGYYENKVIKMGGSYIENYGIRVNGELAIPRAIGDHGTHVSPLPKVSKYAIPQGGQSYLIQCCDGLSEVATTGQIGSAVIKHLSEFDILANNPSELMSIASRLVKQALAAGTTDNVSVIIAAL